MTSLPLRNPDTTSATRLWLWPGLLALVAIGVALSVARAWAILTGASVFAQLAPVLPSPLVKEGSVAEQWYAAHGGLTLTHVSLGAVFLALVPLQVAQLPRRRWPALHRWVGRSLVILGVPLGVSGLVVGALSPFGGSLADAAIAVFGALFLTALTRGFRAARRRDFVTHRAWMLRAVAVAAGIATVRLVALPLYLLVGGSALALVGPTFWLGLGTSSALAEWWLWYSHRGAP